MKRHAYDEGNDNALSFTQDQSWKDQLPKQEGPVAPGPDIPVTLSPEDMRSALPTGMTWAWVDGRFAHSRYLPDAVKNAAELSGSDEMETNRLATLVGRNIAPKDRDIAFGIVHQGQPVIWHSTVDRNSLMDGLVPYLNEAARQVLEDRKNGEDDVLDEFDLRPSFDVAPRNSEHGAYNKMRDERVGSAKETASDFKVGDYVQIIYFDGTNAGQHGRIIERTRAGSVIGFTVELSDGKRVFALRRELRHMREPRPIPDSPADITQDTPEQMHDMVTHASWRRQSEMKRYPEVGKTEGDACSVAEDEDGVYVKTHRSRSKSYPTFEDIPKSEVDQIATTAGWRSANKSAAPDIKGTPLPEILNISLGDETEWFEVQPMKNPWEVESPDEPFQNPWDEPEEEEAPEDPDAVPDFVPEEWPEEAPEDPHEDPDEDEEWHEEEVEEDEKEHERELVPAGRRRASLTRWFRMGAVPQGEDPVDVDDLPMFTEHPAFRVLNVGPDLNLWSGSSGGNHTKWLPKTWMVAQCAKGEKHREIASPDLDGECPCGIYCVDPEQMDVMKPYAEAHPYVIVQLALRGAVRRGNAGAMIAQSAAIANITVPEGMEYFGEESSEQVAEHLRKEYGVPVKVGTTPFKTSRLPKGLTPDVPKLVTDVKTALEILDFRDLVKDTHDELFKYVPLNFKWAAVDDEDRRRLNDAQAVVAKEAGAPVEREFGRDGSKSTYTLQDPLTPALVVLDGDSPVAVAQYDVRNGEVTRIRTRNAIGDPHVLKEFATALRSELDESDRWWEHYFNDGEVDEIDDDFYIVSDSVISEDEIADWLEDQGRSYADNYRRGVSIDGEHVSDESGQIDFLADGRGELKAAVVRNQDGNGYADENVLGVWGDDEYLRKYVADEGESGTQLQWSTEAPEGYADNHGHYGHIEDDNNYIDGEHFVIHDLDDLERFEPNHVGWEDEIVDDYYGNDKGYDDDTDDYGILVWKYEYTRRYADTIDFTPDAWVQCASELGEDFVSAPEGFASLHGKTLKKLTDLPVEMEYAYVHGSFFNGDWDARDYQQDDLVAHVAEHLKGVRPRSEWNHVDEMGQAIDENGGLPNRPLTEDDVAVGDRIEHVYDGDTGTVTQTGSIGGWYKSDADGQEKPFSKYKSLRKLDGPQVRWPESGTQQMAFDTDDYWQSGAGLSPEAEQFIQLLRDSIAQSEGQKSTHSYNNSRQRLTSWKMAGHFTVGPDGRPRYIPSGEELRADGRKYDEPLAGYEHDLEWLRDDVPEDIQWHLEHEAPKRQG